jgi:hypothetical protein
MKTQNHWSFIILVARGGLKKGKSPKLVGLPILVSLYRLYLS